MLTIVFVQVGVDFLYRKNFNDLGRVDGGDSEMTEEEYRRGIIAVKSCIQRQEVDAFGPGSRVRDTGAEWIVCGHWRRRHE